MVCTRLQACSVLSGLIGGSRFVLSGLNSANLMFGKLRLGKPCEAITLCFYVRNRIPSLYLVIVQLCLNSDSKRECVNLRRIVELKLKIWNILYRDKMSVRGFTGHEKRPDKRTAKKIMGQIKDWNLWKKRGLQPF